MITFDHNVMKVTISRKWLPPTHCDEGNHFEKTQTLFYEIAKNVCNFVLVEGRERETMTGNIS